MKMGYLTVHSVKNIKITSTKVKGCEWFTIYCDDKQVLSVFGEEGLPELRIEPTKDETE
jgi:hypothetical protein